LFFHFFFLKELILTKDLWAFAYYSAISVDECVSAEEPGEAYVDLTSGDAGGEGGADDDDNADEDDNAGGANAGEGSNADENVTAESVIPGEPYQMDLRLSAAEQDDFEHRCYVVAGECKTWSSTDEGTRYHNKVDLVFTDPPWSVLQQHGSNRDDDRLYSTDIPHLCDYFAKCLSNTGTVLVRMPVQDWSSWAEAMEKAHLTVEKQPLVVAKDPSRCAQSQARWQGRTACYSMYMVAHKKAQDYVWNRTPSGFLPRNHYGSSAALLTGVRPPTSKERLLDHKKNAFRPQVTAAHSCVRMLTVDVCCRKWT